MLRKIPAVCQISLVQSNNSDRLAAPTATVAAFPLDTGSEVVILSIKSVTPAQLSQQTQMNRSTKQTFQRSRCNKAGWTSMAETLLRETLSRLYGTLSMPQ